MKAAARASAAATKYGAPPMRRLVFTALEGLKGEGGTVLKTSLDHTKEAALQAALAGVKAAVPASAAT